LRLGIRVESVEENDTAVILKYGVRIEADLVVGADGECTHFWDDILGISWNSRVPSVLGGKSCVQTT
jgi:hypothetical protein